MSSHSRALFSEKPGGIAGPGAAAVGRVILRLAVVAVVSQAFVSHAPASPPARGMLDEVARLAASAPGVSPQLSISRSDRPCSVATIRDESIARPVCRQSAADRRLGNRISGLAKRAGDAVKARSDVESMRVLALLDLLWPGGADGPLDRAISTLQTAARVSEQSAPVLADLSAAYLVRAQETQNARDLVEAMEAAGQALAADPRNRAARYNLALALDLNGMDETARAAWSAYLRVDGTSAWADEARRRLRPLDLRPEPTPPADGEDTAAVLRFAARAPLQAQLLGWDRLLGGWGDAVARGDSSLANRHLRFARFLGAGLERRHLDATLADEVREIERDRRDAGALRTLARAHAEYTAARREYVAGDYASAGARLARVRATARQGTPLHQWATVFYAYAAAGTPGAGEPLLRAAALAADSTRHPALAGRAHWLLGSRLLREGRYREARNEYAAAARHFRRAGEREHLGAVLGYAGGAENHLGNPAGAYASFHAALMALRPHRRSLWLHGVLWALADAAAGDGYRLATATILDEDVAAAALSGDPLNSAEARTTRARLLMVGGSPAAALEELRAGMTESLGRVGPAQARAWFRADLQEAEAAALRQHDPERAGALLDSAVAFWGAAGNSLRLLPPLVARANVFLSLGRQADAERDLDAILSALVSERGSLTASAERTTLLDSVRALAGRIVMARIAAHRPEAALRLLEASRAAVLPSALARSWGPGERISALPGETGLVYALVGDTLLVWTVRDTVVRLSRTRVDRTALLATTERVRLRLEQARDDDAPRALRELQSLYGQLIEPVDALLPRSWTTLTIVPDPAFEAVPFAALHDRRLGSYLIQRYAIRVTATLGAAPASPREPGARHALLVAATVFDRRAFPGLPPLPAAPGEVAALARSYPGASVLQGDGATRVALLREIPRAATIHFAGHALFDDQRPERSRLLLAPSGGEGQPADLTAAEIEQLRLRPGSLVVLSACETVRAPSGRSGGFAGMAGAFVAAGARGVVGSLWQVDDEPTSAVLTAFHAAYLEQGDGPAALRSAQLQMLRSRAPRHQSPAAWAGFRYTGQ